MLASDRQAYREMTWAHTKPEFSEQISEPVNVEVPVTEEILAAILTSLKHLERGHRTVYALCRLRSLDTLKHCLLSPRNIPQWMQHNTNGLSLLLFKAKHITVNFTETSRLTSSTTVPDKTLLRTSCMSQDVTKYRIKVLKTGLLTESNNAATVWRKPTIDGWRVQCMQWFSGWISLGPTNWWTFVACSARLPTHLLACPSAHDAVTNALIEAYSKCFYELLSR